MLQTFFTDGWLVATCYTFRPVT